MLAGICNVAGYRGSVPDMWAACHSYEVNISNYIRLHNIFDINTFLVVRYIAEQSGHNKFVMYGICIFCNIFVAAEIHDN